MSVITISIFFFFFGIHAQTDIFHYNKCPEKSDSVTAVVSVIVKKKIKNTGLLTGLWMKAFSEMGV